MELIDRIPNSMSFRVIPTIDVDDEKEIPTGFTGRVRRRVNGKWVYVAWYADGQLQNPSRTHPAYRRFRPDGKAKYDLFYTRGQLQDPARQPEAVQAQHLGDRDPGRGVRLGDARPAAQRGADRVEAGEARAGRPQRLLGAPRVEAPEVLGEPLLEPQRQDPGDVCADEGVRQLVREDRPEPLGVGVGAQPAHRDPDLAVIGTGDPGGAAGDAVEQLPGVEDHRDVVLRGPAESILPELESLL